MSRGESPASEGPVRLTAYAGNGDGASKLSSTELRRLLELVPSFDASPDSNLLVGFEAADDAGVYRLSDDLAVAVAADFSPPLLDDPFDWGRVAAADALSDLYAMGARPLLALNLVAWPSRHLPLELLARILDGAARVVRSAGAVVAGGHSTDEPEPRYGLAVVGTVHPARVLRNAGARPGDSLVLTKPIGTGSIVEALRRGQAPQETLAVAVEIMTALNATAAEAAVRLRASAATDVSGFGLLGHLREVLLASGLSARLDVARVPAVKGARALIAAGFVAEGTRRNWAAAAPEVDWAGTSEDDQLLLCDAQASGGLLLAVDPSRAGALLAAVQPHHRQAAVIGHTTEGTPGRIRLR